MPAPLELIARNAHGNHLAAKRSGGNAIEGLEYHVSSKGKGTAPKKRGDGVIDNQQRTLFSSGDRKRAKIWNPEPQAADRIHKPDKRSVFGSRIPPRSYKLVHARTIDKTNAG